MEDRRPTGELVVVTGMTGAGRSTAAKELEDLGYFVVDNLPPALLRDVVAWSTRAAGSQQPIAVVVDVRSGSFFESLQAPTSPRARPAATATLLFLEATDDVLVRRQEAARRPHPLQGGGRLLDGLAARARRDGRRPRRRRPGHRHHQPQRPPAHRQDRSRRSARPTRPRLKVTVVSFGFKYGIPVDADFVADMRFLPNPHWVPELRPLTGRDEAVADYVKGQPGAAEFLERLRPGARAGRRGLPRARASGSSRSPSAAPAASTAASRCPRRSPRGWAPRRYDVQRHPPRPGPGVTWPADRAVGRRPRGRPRPARLAVRAAAAPRRLTLDQVTAVVTVADNGGSSGRLRGEFGVLPPGDLRMALAALCGDDDWGRTWADVVQHRFAGEGEMNGHVVGNLLIVALWELPGRPRRWPSTGWAGCSAPTAACCRWRSRRWTSPPGCAASIRTTRPRCRPCAARSRSPRPAARSSRSRSTRVTRPPAPEAVAAILEADWVVLGPGSWFTVGDPAPAGARRCARRSQRTAARLVVVLNLEPQAGETDGYGPEDHLGALLEHAP